ncbi:MAG TPA: FecR family protein [Burkholderiales bacterium]|jgi:hypothetical protein|nr:FecR family protein [Burkholderiales bacterium]
MPITQFRLTMTAGAIAALFAPTLYAASAGRVDFATPGVNAIGPGGQSRPVSRGSELQTGETIDTGAGRAQLRFSDGGLVSLQPQTQFRLETYGYDKDDSNKNSIVMSLLKGGLRTITGLIGKTNRQGYKLQTATATVGIRGTEMSIVILANNTILFNCTDGAIDLTNQAGTVTLPAGRSASVSSSTASPSVSSEKPFLPPGSYSVTQLSLPTNPVQDAQTILPTILTGTFAGQWRTIDHLPNGNAQGYGDGFTPTFTVGTDGMLKSYSTTTPDFGYGTTTTGGTLTGSGIVDGNDGVMAWGRWTGTAAGIGSSSGATYTAADPLHYVVGLPVTALPTSGTATYTMYGGTTPSCTGGGCGLVGISGSLSVNFGNFSGSYAMNVSNSVGSANISATGGLGFDGAGVGFNSTGSIVSGTTSTGNISSGIANLSGFLAGPAASHAGAVYNVTYTPYGTSLSTSINGAAVFQRGAIGPTIINVQ